MLFLEENSSFKKKWKKKLKKRFKKCSHNLFLPKNKFLLEANIWKIYLPLGLSKKQVIERLKELQELDSKSRTGKMFAYVYHTDDKEYEEVSLREECSYFVGR
jgi:hypothetical protein